MTDGPTATIRRRLIREIMIADAITVEPSASVTELARVLDANDISGVPVVDGQDRVLGVVSKTDLLHFILNHEDGHFAPAHFFETLDEESEISEQDVPDASTTVEEIMNDSPITVRADAPLAAVAHRMAGEHVHRVIVTDDKGLLVGVVTSIDLLRVFPE